MIAQRYQLNEAQREALRVMAAWEFSCDETSPYASINGHTRKRLIRLGLVDRDRQMLTDAGVVTAALLEEIDQLQSSRKEF